jgi:tetratricopeptide (TPR) repeat protein
MSWWKNLISGGSDLPPRDTDYYQEGTDLLRQEKYHEALTSFQLALREDPNDPGVLLQIAMTYTLIGMTDEAIRRYRRVLELKPDSVGAQAGAHYGLAFLLLPRGSVDEGISHLRAFLANPPGDEVAARHVAHAREVLLELTGETVSLPERMADE